MAFTTTASGLQYEDTVVGDGAEAQRGRSVTVHYTGWLYNNGVQGAKFDSSKDRNDPFVFPLGGGMVIKGWDEGVQGMKVGGQRTLIIPAELGYGARGAGGVIPPQRHAEVRRGAAGRLSLHTQVHARARCEGALPFFIAGPPQDEKRTLGERAGHSSFKVPYRTAPRAAAGSWQDWPPRAGAVPAPPAGRSPWPLPRQG